MKISRLTWSRCKDNGRLRFHWSYLKAMEDWSGMSDRRGYLENNHTKYTDSAELRQLKILHRLRYTPVMRARFGLSSTNCNKCNRKTGTWTHMFRWCTKIKMKKELDVLIGHNVTWTSHLFSVIWQLRCWETVTWRNSETIHKVWTPKAIPMWDDWHKEVIGVVPLEKLTHSLHDNMVQVSQRCSMAACLDEEAQSGLSFSTAS